MQEDFSDFISSSPPSKEDVKSKLLLSNSQVQKFKPVIDYLRDSLRNNNTKLYVNTRKFGYKASSFITLFRRTLKILIDFSDQQESLNYASFNAGVILVMMGDEEVVVKSRMFSKVVESFDLPESHTTHPQTWKEDIVDFVLSENKETKTFAIPEAREAYEAIETICKEGQCKYSFDIGKVTITKL